MTNKNDRIISSIELLEILKEERKNKKILIIRSGIPSLDNLIESFEGGELTIISGHTGSGKTLLAQTFTTNFAKQGINSVWFNYEVQPIDFLFKFGVKIPLFYLPEALKEKNLEWINKKIYEAKTNFDCKVVFIDHLHFIIDMATRLNMSLEIGRVMRDLKKLALGYDMCFFLIAHTQKIKPDENIKKELGLGDVRDSSFIEQEADNVFYIWRRKSKENESRLKIAKNRRYGVFEKKINLIKVGCLLGEKIEE